MTCRRLRAAEQRAGFAPEALPFESLGGLLASLTQIEPGGLPKYRYPSGGGLYPVQTYVYVKPGRVQDLAPACTTTTRVSTSCC